MPRPPLPAGVGLSAGAASTGTFRPSGPLSETGRRTVNDRNASLDYLRLLAAVGIVWFHSMATGNRVAYLALPFFLVLLGRPSGAAVADLARRLL